ncbi:hypothetical protein RhiirC2_797507 [Rhizophagus irregularis]|uniref:Secreted protein n=1 Tax=Rhizophagus irregularis TaxID=588596 RepID=A0A2N1M7Y5_9GLOM|nr:hypothetical protein RhiirC2_797507 [Rhizophagus irregularis]
MEILTVFLLYAWGIWRSSGGFASSSSNTSGGLTSSSSNTSRDLTSGSSFTLGSSRNFTSNSSFLHEDLLEILWSLRNISIFVPILT